MVTSERIGHTMQHAMRKIVSIKCGPPGSEIIAFNSEKVRSEGSYKDPTSLNYSFKQTEIQRWPHDTIRVVCATLHRDGQAVMSTFVKCFKYFDFPLSARQPTSLSELSRREEIPWEQG